MEKKMKMWKVYRRTDRQTDRRTDRQTDDGRQVIRKAHLSFQLRWAKKGLKVCTQVLNVLNLNKLHNSSLLKKTLYSNKVYIVLIIIQYWYPIFMHNKLTSKLRQIKYCLQMTTIFSPSSEFWQVLHAYTIEIMSCTQDNISCAWDIKSCIWDIILCCMQEIICSVHEIISCAHDITSI